MECVGGGVLWERKLNRCFLFTVVMCVYVLFTRVMCLYIVYRGHLFIVSFEHFICLTAVRYVQHWLSQSPEFLQGESKEIRTEALGLFLLGTGAFTPTIWIKALHHTHVLNDGR